MPIFLTALTFLLLLPGCSTRGLKHQQNNHYTQGQEEALVSHNDANTSVKQLLYQQYEKWHFTPYSYGGTTLSGVDCSALVQSVFRDAFGVELPRTTLQQLYVGYRISKSRLQAGDIVFFKTGYNVRHAGIYIENGNFMHASSTYGVKLSNINKSYWKSRYMQSRRVLP